MIGITDEELKDLYVRKRKSANQIGRLIGVSGETIRTRLHVLGVELRDRNYKRVMKVTKPTPEQLAEMRSKPLSWELLLKEKRGEQA